MPIERPNPRDIDTRTEAIDEPMGSIEFGPRPASSPGPALETSGEDYKPGTSSNVGGNENAAVRKAEGRDTAKRRSGGFLRTIWRRIADRVT